MDAEERWFVELAGRRVSLSDGDFLIGRDRDCDLPLADGTVSRHHAVLATAGERLLLRDLGSSNGTFANGQPVAGEVELSAGDRLRLGRVRLAVGRGAAEATVPGRRFCPSCGTWVAAHVERCDRCGEDFSSERPLSRSEAVAMSEVMAVGEALATPPQSGRPLSPLAWEEPEGPPTDACDETMAAPRPVATLRPDVERSVAVDDTDGRRGRADAGSPVRPGGAAPPLPARRRLLPPHGGIDVDGAWIAGVGLLAAAAAGGATSTAGR